MVRVNLPGLRVYFREHCRAGGGGVVVVEVEVAFSSRAWILGECSTFNPRLRFFLFFIFCKWRSARAHWFRSVGQDQPTVAPPPSPRLFLVVFSQSTARDSLFLLFALSS